MKPNFGVGIILFDFEKGYLLQLRDNKSGIFCPNQWAYFSGGIESIDFGNNPLETALNCANRELLEETGLNLKLDFFYSDLIPRLNLKRFFFMSFIQGIDSETIDLREGQKVDYFQISHFPKNMHSSVRKIFIRHSVYFAKEEYLSFQNSNPIGNKMR